MISQKHLFIYVAFSLLLYFSFLSQSQNGECRENEILPIGATTGYEFQLIKKRSYKPTHYIKNSFKTKNIFNCKSTNFAVTTTINEPTEAIKQFINHTDVCLIVVADQKTPIYYELKAFNIFFLSIDIQKSLPYNILKIIPYNNFARKCIGYLFAIENGAKMIYDFDDDNILIDESFEKIFSETKQYKLLSSPSISINPYDFYLPNKSITIWPRGYPLQNIKSDYWNLTSNSNNQPKVIQFLQNQNPDLDAIYRLTQNIPSKFKDYNFCININFSSYSPFNSQATLFTYETFPTLILPMTVNGRVSDIWRSYIVQKILKSKSQFIAFCPSIVNHIRNPHKLIRDFNAEIPLYSQTYAFLQLLENIELNFDIYQNILTIYSKLYEYDFIQYYDMKFLDFWLYDLQQIGFNF